jgi:hypothetical protein
MSRETCGREGSIHGTSFRGFSISKLINTFCSAFTLHGDKKYIQSFGKEI